MLKWLDDSAVGQGLVHADEMPSANTWSWILSYDI